jgi:hypothetical protein
LRADRARRYPIDFRCKRRKIDVRLDLGQRVTEAVDLLPVMIVGKSVLMAVRFFMAGVRERNQDNAILPIAGGRGFSRCPTDPSWPGCAYVILFSSCDGQIDYGL